MARVKRFTTCPYCGGEGCDEVSSPQHDDPHFAVVVKCDECNGSGWVDEYGTPPGVDYDYSDDMGAEFPFAENH